MTYHFPRITLPGDVIEVSWKCVEELIEFETAIDNDEGVARELEEFCDAWQAFETLHRKVTDKYGTVAVELASAMVVNKNDHRGYYR